MNCSKLLKANPVATFAGGLTLLLTIANIPSILADSDSSRSLAAKSSAMKASELARRMDRNLAKQRLANGCIIALNASDNTKYFNGLRDGLKVDLPTGSIVCSHIGGVAIVKDGKLTETIAGDASAVGEAVKNVHSGSVLMEVSK
jgi:predicted trehalose synthase